VTALLEARFVLEYRYKRSTGPVIGEALAALQRGEILGARAATGEILVPPREYDPRTGRATEGLVAVASTGTLRSWTLQADGTAWGLIHLDGAASSMLHRVSGAPLVTGARVKAVWRDDRQGCLDDIRHFAVESP